MKKVPYFESTEKIFQEYYHAAGKLMDKKKIPFDQEMALETRKRLRQMQMILSEVVEIEDRIREEYLPKIKHGILGGSFKSDKKLNSFYERNVKKLELSTECFYYISFRFCALLSKLLFNKKDVGRVSAGVREVRNNLLEHADGKNGVMIISFGHGGPAGPVLKVARYKEQNQYKDQGIFINCQEVKDNTEKYLKEEILKIKKELMNL